MIKHLVLALTLAGCALAHEVPRDTGPNDASPSASVLIPCTGGGMAGTGRDCGWNAGGNFACRPGSTVQVGCAAGCGLGSCSGDTVIRVCDTGPCTGMQALAADDDSSCGSLCSFIDGVTCPASGQIFVLVGPFSAGSPFTCSFTVR